ncbi:hypothetical protein [Plantactinospora sp. CA-290183]|uniref:hypothetical protein n=1 Tax=Plantactinospora sp. CA-290183 TaxID=3240006 RepID=UPI003D905F06
MHIDDPHVLPPDEADRHLTISCPCGATSESAQRRDGSTAWLTIHRRWDGRDAWESRP